MGFGKRPLETLVTPVDADFWSGKRVLVTGHSGFKGGWLSLWLLRRGAAVTGISLPPQTTPSLFELTRLADRLASRFADIREAAPLAALVREADPDIVFHLAAQPLVRTGYSEPVATFASNVLGTVHLLEALRQVPRVRVAVMITTDKVYRNNEWCYPYREDDRLGGHDPYSASKAASELAIASYRDAFLAGQGVAVASARAGNVIGGGDWSRDRLLPDAVRAWQTDSCLDIRRPGAVRPWQHVLEALAGYLVLAERLWRNPALAGAYNFGPDLQGTATVREVIALARQAYGAGEVRYGDGGDGPHEAGCLELETARARAVLGVRSRWTLPEAVARAMRWYREQHAGADALALCQAEIAAYEAAP